MTNRPNQSVGVKERNLGIELLRIVSMFLIIVLHCLGLGGAGKCAPEHTVQNSILWFLTAVCYGSANLYALTSGYVCIRATHRWERMIELWLQVFLYSVGIFAVDRILGGSGDLSWRQIISLLLPVTSNRYWYFSAYFFLFAFLPFINPLLERLSKRQYQHITGRQQKNNIIAYQIRQSFKPGEITPEEANQVGYETAMRWTKGKHAFIVATHIDKSHIHNHIIYNSTSLDATRKFKNFFLSGLAVQRLSDMVCLEHGLSIITPKPYRERQKRTVYPKKRTQRDELCDAIDAVLKQKPKSFDGFVQALADMGFEFKDGKQPAFTGENQKRFIRLRSLGEGYSKEEIQAVISGKNLHKSKGGSAKAPAPKQFQMLIDIQAKMAEGKTVGYEKWAKKFNRKEAARTVILLKEKGLGNYDDLTAHIENLSARFDALSDSIKVAEKRMVEVQALQQHIKNYRNTRQIYIEYRKSGYSKKFFEEHRQEITIHKAAKQAFDELQITKLPSMQSLYEEFHQLAVQKKQDYAEYRQIRKEKEELLIAKRTVETILNIDRQKEQEKEKEKEEKKNFR